MVGPRLSNPGRPRHRRQRSKVVLDLGDRDPRRTHRLARRTSPAGGVRDGECQPHHLDCKTPRGRDGVHGIETRPAAHAGALGGTQAAGRAALGLEAKGIPCGVGEPDAILPIVLEKERDRILRARALRAAQDVGNAGPHLEPEGARTAGPRKLAKKAPVVSNHLPSSSARRAISLAARRPVSNATPSPVRSAEGSKPPIRSPATNRFSNRGSPSAPRGRSRESVRTPEEKRGCGPSGEARTSRLGAVPSIRTPASSYKGRSSKLSCTPPPRSISPPPRKRPQ